MRKKGNTTKKTIDALKNIFLFTYLFVYSSIFIRKGI